LVAEREMPSGIPRPEGMQTDHLPLPPPAAAQVAPGVIFLSPASGVAGANRSRGSNFYCGGGLKENFGAPRPLRAQGRGCFFEAGGP